MTGVPTHAHACPISTKNESFQPFLKICPNSFYKYEYLNNSLNVWSDFLYPVFIHHKNHLSLCILYLNHKNHLFVWNNFLYDHILSWRKHDKYDVLWLGAWVCPNMPNSALYIFCIVYLTNCLSVLCIFFSWSSLYVFFVFLSLIYIKRGVKIL